MAEKILQPVTDTPTEYTITKGEFEKLQELAGSIDEISRLGGVDTNPLQSTLTILARDFFDVLEPVSEKVKGGERRKHGRERKNHS